MLTRTVNKGGGDYHKEDGELVKERLIYGKLGGGQVSRQEMEGGQVSWSR